MLSQRSSLRAELECFFVEKSPDRAANLEALLSEQAAAALDELRHDHRPAAACPRSRRALRESDPAALQAPHRGSRRSPAAALPARPGRARLRARSVRPARRRSHPPPPPRLLASSAGSRNTASGANARWRVNLWADGIYVKAGLEKERPLSS